MHTIKVITKLWPIRILIAVFVMANITLTQSVIAQSGSSPLERGFQLYTDKPMIEPGPAGTWDSVLLNGAAVVYANGQYHMLYNGLLNRPDFTSLGYATSADGITWTKHGTEPVFTKANMGWAAQAAGVEANSVVVDGDAWVLYFVAFTKGNANSMAGEVGRATAPAPTGPWTVDPEPVLKPGQPGEWDASGIAQAKVLRAAQGYVMYYSSAFQIGMATSADGKTWTKYKEPVLSGALCEDPNVQQTATGWIMVYRTMTQPVKLFYATSPDGIHWTPMTDQPLVSARSFPNRNIFFSGLVVHDGVASLYFEVAAATFNATSRIFLARWNEPAP